MRTSPFDTRSGGRLGRLHPHCGHQVRQHDLLDAALAERGQHALDVPQEHPVRPHDEHALIFERKAVCVEEVRRAVQRDDRLARARTTLHDQDPGQRRADDLVLLRLDRGDDVAELTGARLFERSDQRARADQPVVAVTVAISVEELVLDPDERAALEGEVTAAGETHRGTAGRPVERLGHGRSPVDYHRLLALVRDREAADVEGLAGVAVDAAEHEGSVSDLEVSEPVADRLFDHVALVAGLVCATSPDLGQASQPKCLLTRPCRGSRRHDRCRPALRRARCVATSTVPRGSGGSSHEGRINGSGARRQSYGTIAP